MKFYIDTNIWVDWFEDRKGFHGEPLGEYAERLFAMIREQHDTIIVTNLIIYELESQFSMEEINGMMRTFKEYIQYVSITEETKNTAKIIAQKRNIPQGDVIHALTAKEYDARLITRDIHYYKLLDITNFYRPEEII
ncbi:MAG: type II toxin-antitoxin system VapC family toxin [Candidatus Woesearchaeota archaeon]